MTRKSVSGQKKSAIKHALKLKSFMHEKIAATQLQSRKVSLLRQQKVEEQSKMKEEKTAKEQKTAQKVSKDNKEKATSSLAGLLKSK